MLPAIGSWRHAVRYMQGMLVVTNRPYICQYEEHDPTNGGNW